MTYWEKFGIFKEFFCGAFSKKFFSPQILLSLPFMPKPKF